MSARAIQLLKKELVKAAASLKEALEELRVAENTLDFARSITATCQHEVDALKAAVEKLEELAVPVG